MYSSPCCISCSKAGKTRFYTYEISEVNQQIASYQNKERMNPFSLIKRSKKKQKLKAFQRALFSSWHRVTEVHSVVIAYLGYFILFVSVLFFLILDRK